MKAITAELDGLSIEQLMERYDLGKTQFYERKNRLKLEFDKPKGSKKAIASSAQIQLLDELDDYLKLDGTTIDQFCIMKRIDEPSEQFGELSTYTQSLSDPSLAILTLFDRMTRIMPNSDPIGHIRLLDEACEKGWRLSTPELAQLLQLRTLRGNEIRRYGFICIRQGKNGTTSAWKIQRDDL
ncbi:MAG: hypothetical protein J0L70_11155 [Leptolyngbya sp. UWPOB_LEPTO1]|uniref:hypothetical protein n=1 Tax=Leptolyngbya sp. UWPOB_LEPTO1 TaxID=2815653 RepID=UPI001AD5D291|nr:hypothetical protein [Leptolyngbya sp. UWPOB_LEPTO1]MBN8561074.1 hypothetical protein [Leptolyngbya sp. UWPOB_LEPTO1]